MRRKTARWISLMIFLVLPGPSLAVDVPVVKMTSFDKPSFGHSIATLIEAKEFDKKNGIDIEWTFKPGRAANMDFATGRDKITLASAVLSEANRRAKGVKTVYLFNVLNLFGALLTENPNIRTLKDLEGKKIAAFTVTTNYAMFRYYAKKAGVDLSKVEVQSTNATALVTVLMAKRADAIHVWEPNYSKILHQNPGRFHAIKYVGDWSKYNKTPDRGYLGVAAHEEWANDNKGTIQKVYKAFKDLGEWLPSHHDEAAGILSEATGVPKGALLKALKEKRYDPDVVPAVEIQDSIEAVFRAGVESGYLKKMPDKGIIYTGLKK